MRIELGEVSFFTIPPAGWQEGDYYYKNGAYSKENYANRCRGPSYPLGGKGGNTTSPACHLGKLFGIPEGSLGRFVINVNPSFHSSKTWRSVLVLSDGIIYSHNGRSVKMMYPFICSARGIYEGYSESLKTVESMNGTEIHLSKWRSVVEPDETIWMARRKTGMNGRAAGGGHTEEEAIGSYYEVEI